MTVLSHLARAIHLDNFIVTGQLLPIYQDLNTPTPNG
jgi:hypothetical protein